MINPIKIINEIKRMILVDIVDYEIEDKILKIYLSEKPEKMPILYDATPLFFKMKNPVYYLNDELTIILKWGKVIKDDMFPRIITSRQRYEVLTRQKWKCAICGCSLKYSKKSAKKWNKDFDTAEIDHIWAWSLQKIYPGGAENINSTENLQALCKTCNLSKSNKVKKEVLEKLKKDGKI